MKNFLKFFTLSLLLFNAVGALYGGFQLIKNPAGNSIGLPLILLKHTGFDNYMIPGIILFVFNGLYGIFVSALVLFNASHNALFVIVQGAILSGWIIIQLLLIKTFSSFHIILGGMGLTLIILGYIQAKDNTIPTSINNN